MPVVKIVSLPKAVAAKTLTDSDMEPLKFPGILQEREV
jgi:hypothetical protein